MATESEIRRYQQNWQKENNAAFLYEQIARREKNAARAELFQRLAAVETKHAQAWEALIAAAGKKLPAANRDWRTRILAWLAKQYGAKFVVPSLAMIEKDAGAEYAQQPEAVALRMPQEEQSHAKVFAAMNQPAQGMAGNAIANLEGRHSSMGGNALRAGVLGANDGLVSNLSLVMGVAGAQVSHQGILITGLAGLLAGAISMALGEWLSVNSSRELAEHQIKIEQSELAANPAEEMEELALIYQAKGLPEAEAQNLAKRLLSDPQHALDTLTREELGIDPAELGGSAWEAAGASFLLFALGAILPVLPFIFTPGANGIIWSLATSTLGLFVIGAGITLVTGKHAVMSGLRMVLFGLTAAAVTFGIGRLIGVNIGG